MNKFTRSQMGKIMACALSAAMAVTVVPTYMKPVIAFAADVTLGEATSVQQGAVLYNDGVSDTSVVKLYTNTGDSTPAYTLTPTNYGTDDDPAYVVVVPYTVETGKYYVKTNDDKPDKDSEVVEVTAGTAAKGVVLPSDMNIYYTSDGEKVEYTNRVVLPISLKGADTATYSNISITADYEEAYDDTKGDSGKWLIQDAETVELESGTVATAGAFELTYDAKTGTITAKVKDGVDVPNTDRTDAQHFISDNVTINVSINVVGRVNPYTAKIVLTAKEDEAAPIDKDDLSVTFANSLVKTGTEVEVTATNKNTASKQDIYYVLKDDASPTPNSSDPAQNGILTLKDGDDKVLATYDINAGILTPVKAGKYTLAMFVDENANGEYDDGTDAACADATITAVSFSMDTIAGKVGETGKTSFDGADGVDITFVEYTVADTDVATVSGNDEEATVTFRKAGITEVTAIITCKENGNTYKFEESTYIVVAPKDGTTNLEVDNAELYINELANADLLSDELALEVANAIVDVEMNALLLGKNAYAAAEDALYETLDDYNYEINNTAKVNDTEVEATGLLFAIYDKDVAGAEEPDEPVVVKLEINSVSPKDYAYVKDGSVCNFNADVTVDGVVKELQQPLWLTVTDDNLKAETKYTIYDNGDAEFVAKSSKADANGDVTLTFQTTSFSVFSVVATPDATLTDNAAGLDKDDNSSTTSDIYDKVNFVAHVQRRIGTDDKADIEQTLSEDGVITIGTHGQSRRIEKITLTGLDAEDVEMTAHVQKRVDHPEDIADLTQVVNEDGSISIGTEHQSRRIEAFSMKLKGDLAEQYDVYYRVHAQNYGWLGWAKNGETAGTSGHSFRLEGIEIIFVEKGTEFDETQYAKTTEEGDRGYAGQAAYMDRK